MSKVRAHTRKTKYGTTIVRAHERGTNARKTEYTKRNILRNEKQTEYYELPGTYSLSDIKTPREIVRRLKERGVKARFKSKGPGRIAVERERV